MSSFSTQDIVDERGGKLLAMSLDERYIHFKPWSSDDKTADSDGRLRLRDGKSQYINKILEYQQKSEETVKDNKFYFRRKVIDYLITTNIPTLAFVVDVKREKVFWYYFGDKVEELNLNDDNSGRTIDLIEYEVNGNCAQLEKIWEKIAKTEPPQPDTSGGGSLTGQESSVIKEETPSQVQSVLNYDVISEYQSELDHARDLINNRQPVAAISLLEDLKKRNWYKSDNLVKFRILTNLGAAKLALEEEPEACRLFLEAYHYNPNDEKALSNNALAYLLTGDKQKATEYARKTLDKNPTSEQGLSVFLQSANENDRNKFVEELPTALKNSSAVYFSLGFVERNNNNYELSEKYLRKAILLDDGKSLEISSTLAGVLIEKNVPLLKKLEIEGLVIKENKDVEEAIDLLNNVWEKVENTEMAKAKIEWLVNRSFAKRILGRFEDALTDAKRSFDLAPQNMRVVKNFATLSWDLRKYDDAYKLLTQYKESNEFPEASFLMALVKREQKEFDVAISLLKEKLEKSNLANDMREDGSGLLIETYMMAGKKKEAERYVSKELKKDSNNILFLIFSSRIYEEQGDIAKAVQHAKQAVSNLNSKSTAFNKIMVANQLYKLKQFKNAQSLYEDTIDKSVYSPLVYKLLYSYYETNSYAKGLALARLITDKQGEIEDVLKIQAAILEEQGDLEAEVAANRKIVEINPHNIVAKIQIGYLLLRQNKLEELDKFLEETNFDLKNLSLMNRYRLAYLFSVRGKTKLFLETIYETRRKFFDDKEAHVEYIRLFFIRTPEIDTLLEANKVKVGTAVLLKYPDGRVEHYVIEDREDASKALREITPDEELTKKLLGKKVGDSIEISPRLIAEIIEVKSKYVHALHESSVLHQALFNNVSDLQSIYLGEPKKEGELPEGFDVIKKQITEQYEHTQKIEELYKNNQITIGAFASLIGRDIIEVWGGMVAEEKLGVNYSRGDLQERIESVSKLKKKPVLVVDPIALLTISSLEMGEQIIKNYGKLGIAQSTIDLITEQIAHLEPAKDKGYLSLRKQGEQFTKQEVTSEKVKRNISYLEKIIKWVKKNCNVLVVEAVEDISKEQKEKLEKIIGMPSLDTILICRKEGRMMLSDDERLRTVAKNDYGISGIWTQALLMDALAKGSLSQEEYDDFVVKLVSLNYYYTSVSGKNLFHALKKAEWKMQEPFIHTLKILEPRFSDVDSAVRVSVDFIYEILTHRGIVVDIDTAFFYLFDALTKERPMVEIVNLLQQELQRKLYLLPIDFVKVKRIIENWSKTKIF